MFELLSSMQGPTLQILTQDVFVTFARPGASGALPGCVYVHAENGSDRSRPGDLRR